MSTTHQFLSTLFAGLGGAIELRPVPAVPSLRDFCSIYSDGYDTYKVDCYVERCTAQKVNAFFGVATRRIGARSGRAEDCVELPALFIDCDIKHSNEGQVLEAIAGFPLAPSMVVNSGMGYHAYWLLDEPLSLSDAQEVARATDIMRRLAAAFPAVADESVSEPARVLRLPGTRNFKYPHAPEVTLDICEPERRYTLADVCEHIPAVAPLRPWKSGGGASLRPGDAAQGTFCLPESIAPGDRHTTMFALLRSQQVRGLSFEAAYASCAIENTNRSEVPIEDAELERFLRRAWGTANREIA
jgi:hypothetical protein